MINVRPFRALTGWELHGWNLPLVADYDCWQGVLSAADRNAWQANNLACLDSLLRGLAQSPRGAVDPASARQIFDQRAVALSSIIEQSSSAQDELDRKLGGFWPAHAISGLLAEIEEATSEKFSAISRAANDLFDDSSVRETLSLAEACAGHLANSVVKRRLSALKAMPQDPGPLQDLIRILELPRDPARLVAHIPSEACFTQVVCLGLAIESLDSSNGVGDNAGHVLALFRLVDARSTAETSRYRAAALRLLSGAWDFIDSCTNEALALTDLELGDLLDLLPSCGADASARWPWSPSALYWLINMLQANSGNTLLDRASRSAGPWVSAYHMTCFAEPDLIEDYAHEGSAELGVLCDCYAGAAHALGYPIAARDAVVLTLALLMIRCGNPIANASEWVARLEDCRPLSAGSVELLRCAADAAEQLGHPRVEQRRQLAELAARLGPAVSAGRAEISVYKVRAESNISQHEKSGDLLPTQLRHDLISAEEMFLRSAPELGQSPASFAGVLMQYCSAIESFSVRAIVGTPLGDPNKAKPYVRGKWTLGTVHTVLSRSAELSGLEAPRELVDKFRRLVSLRNQSHATVNASTLVEVRGLLFAERLLVDLISFIRRLEALV